MYTRGLGIPLPGWAAAPLGSAVFTLATALVGGIAGWAAPSFQAGLGPGWRGPSGTCFTTLEAPHGWSQGRWNLVGPAGVADTPGSVRFPSSFVHRFAPVLVAIRPRGLVSRPSAGPLVVPLHGSSRPSEFKASGVDQLAWVGVSRADWGGSTAPRRLGHLKHG